MKIAICGGSFNPITKGHTRIANYIISKGIVDKVLIMPCYKSLYNKSLESGYHRIKMIELANKMSGVEPFDWEIVNKIEGQGTYDIMKQLEKYFMNDELYFVMGLDNSQKVKKWIKGIIITNEFKFIVVPRVGTQIEDSWFMMPPHIYVKDYTEDAISSTAVKELLHKGVAPKEMLDEAIYRYIIENNLYKE